MTTKTEGRLERISNVVRWLGILIGGVTAIAALFWAAVEVAWSYRFEEQLRAFVATEVIEVMQSDQHAADISLIQLTNLARLDRSHYENLDRSDRLSGNLIEEMLAVPDLDEFRRRVDSVYSFEMSRMYPTVFRDRQPPSANTNPDEGGIPSENNKVRLFLNRNDTVRLYAFEDISGPNGRILQSPPARIWLQIGSLPENLIYLDGGVENILLNCKLEKVFSRRRNSQNEAVEVSVQFEATSSVAIEYNFDLFFIITKEERQLDDCT